MLPQMLSGQRDHQGHVDGLGSKNQGGELSPGGNEDEAMDRPEPGFRL